MEMIVGTMMSGLQVQCRAILYLILVGFDDKGSANKDTLEATNKKEIIFVLLMNSAI